MDETERAPTAELLLQGDVIRLVGGDKNHGFDLGVIINADCDMQNKKHDGVIAFLPIYTFKGYLEKFWFNRFIIERKNEVIAALKKIVSIEDRHVDELVLWIESGDKTIREKGAEIIFKDYHLGDKAEQKADEVLSKLIDVVEFSLAGLEGVSKFRAKDASAEKYCKSLAIEAIKQMGSDHFFVTEIRNDDSIGFVVRMRRIYTIPAESCFKTNSDFESSKSNGFSGYRICRLTPYYKFKVSQLFAHQFTRIGLPDQTTKLSELAIADISNHFQAFEKK